MTPPVANIIAGPAEVTFGGSTFYSAGDIKLSITRNTIPISVDAYGEVDERDADCEIKVAFQPAGLFNALSVCWPHATTIAGTPLTSSTNAPLTIWSWAGQKLIFANAAVTKPPPIVFSSVKTLLGEIEFESFVKDGIDRSAANSRWTLTSSSFTGDTSFDPSGILTQPYSIGWLDSPWDAFDTKDGLTVDFAMTTTPIQTDGAGIISRRFQQLKVTAKGTVEGVAETDILAAINQQGSGVVRGQTIASGSPLIVTGTGVYVSLPNVGLKQAPMSYSNKTDRIGELMWTANPGFTAGVRDARFYVGTSAPS